MLPPIPAVLRYRAENFPDGFEPVTGVDGHLELHRVTENPRSSLCIQTFTQGPEAMTNARKRAWELLDALGEAVLW